MGKVRALGRQSALIYPILLRFASQDGPLSSPASQEKTLLVIFRFEPSSCSFTNKAKQSPVQLIVAHVVNRTTVGLTGGTDRADEGPFRHMLPLVFNPAIAPPQFQRDNQA